MLFKYKTLDDNTEITHTELLENEEVKIYIETQTPTGYNSLVMTVPNLHISASQGYTEGEIQSFISIIVEEQAEIIRAATQISKAEDVVHPKGV